MHQVYKNVAFCWVDNIYSNIWSLGLYFKTLNSFKYIAHNTDNAIRLWIMIITPSVNIELNKCNWNYICA